MANEIPLLVRPLASLVGGSDAFVPDQALTAYFRALGIGLRFIAGLPLDTDPTDHPDEIDAFCREQAPRPPGTLPWPGVVLVGDMSVDGPGTNGILLDLEHRGVCAVFTQSFAFTRGSADARFEIYAHEIGHMLNLSHAEADDPFPTAMSQWDARDSVGDRRTVWRQAIKHASPLQRTRLASFFGNGTGIPIGLPMSAKCCNWLANADQSNILPWGSEFKDLSQDGTEDASFGLVKCHLIVQTLTGSVAQPVDLQVRVSVGPERDEVDLPTTLDLRSGLIEIHITSPHGVTRKYRTKSRTCGTSRKSLKRDGSIRRNYTLIGDSRGVLFPVPGTYRLEAVLPTLGARSGIVEFHVGPAIGPFANSAFQTFLSKDMPDDDPTGWRMVEEVLQSRAISPATKVFLKSKAIARGRRPFAPLDEVRREASPRVLERDALLRVVRLRRQPPSNSGTLRRAIDDAEEVLRATDSANPSIQYLEHVRKHADLGR